MVPAPCRRGIEFLLMFLSALLGRGGGSGWDTAGQNRALARHAQPKDNMIILDVGANDGRWIADVDKQFRRYRPHYHAFECAPYCFENFERNTRDISELKLIRKAVSDRAGSMTLYLPDTGSGLASLHERHDTSVRSHEYGTLEVEVVDLDSYIEANGITQVDVLKIDVEGHEVSVLEGARRALKEHRIAAIMFEFGSATINSRTFFGDFWNLFDALSYDLHVVLPGGGTYKIDRYRDELEYFRGASNYIATRRPSNAAGVAAAAA